MLLMLIAGLSMGGVAQIVNGLSVNVAHVILNRALWQEQQNATARQQALALSARFYEVAAKDREAAFPDARSQDSCQMISSIIAAEYYRRQAAYDMTARWLNRAAHAPPCPPVQKAVVLPAYVQPSVDGSVVVDGASPRWSVRRDTVVDAAVQSKSEEFGVFSFVSAPESRRAVFVWRLPFGIPYHHTAVIKSRVEPGCTLHIETVVDAESVRHPAQVGLGEWKLWEFTVQGESLRFIYILLDDNRDASTNHECVAEIEYIAFLLDKALVTCK